LRDRSHRATGLKQNLLYIIKRSAKVIRCVSLEKGDDDMSKEERFVGVLEL